MYTCIVCAVYCLIFYRIASVVLHTTCITKYNGGNDYFLSLVLLLIPLIDSHLHYAFFSFIIYRDLTL